MSIEVDPAALYALAATLRSAAGRADDVAAAVSGDPVGGPVGPAVQAFGETVVAAGRGLAGELGWLGDAVAGAADSWLGLDRSLLPRAAMRVPE